MKNSLVIGFFVLVLVACKTEEKSKRIEDDVATEVVEYSEEPQKKPEMKTTTASIAEVNGFRFWKDVKEVRFTFNVDKDSMHFQRSWGWLPKKEKVTYFSEKDTITYDRTQIDNDSTAIALDKGFINDKYWLLAPFNLIWDSNSFVSKHEHKAISPISGEEMQKLTIVYNKKDGYTPGDAYDFYFKGDFMIKEWVYRQGNTEEQTLITTWEDYRSIHGIKVAQMHHRKDEDWKLYFTDVEIITE